MPATSACRSTSTDHQTDPFSAMRAVNRSKLSKGSKVLYSQLRISAGHRGTIQYRIAKLAEHTDSSETSIKSYLGELKAVGLVIPQHRLGRSNLWYVFDPSPTWDGTVPDLTQATGRPHRGGGPTGGGSADRPHKNVLENVRTQNVKNVPGSEDPNVRVPEAEVRDEMNVENVVKSWPKETEENSNTPDDEDLPVRAIGDTCTPTEDPEVRSTPYSSAFSHDPACATGAACTPGDPGDLAADPEKVEETSAKFQNRGDHGTRTVVDRTPVRVPDDTGTGVDSPMRVRGPRSRKIFDAGLLQEILDLTGDRKSLGCWISCVSRLPEEEIRIAMSSLKQAMAESDVYRPGAYLLGVIRSRNPDFTFSSKGKKKSHGQNHDDSVLSTEGHQGGTRTPDHVRVPVVPPAPPEPPAPSIEELVKGWRFASRSISIPRLLEIMRTSVGEILDPSTLWKEVKDLCSGLDERTTVDRFLQVVTTRLRHKAAQTVV